MTDARLSVGPPHFLVVEDNDLVAAAYRRAISKHGIVSVASSVAEAGLVIAGARLTGLIVDVELPDGSGLEVARAARLRDRNLPIVVISGGVDARRLGDAHQIEATYLLKPVGTTDLRAFVERAIARERRAERLLSEWTGRYGLSAAEAMTLRLAVNGLQRDEIAARRGVGAGTVKSQVHGLLSKLGLPSMADAKAAFFRELAG